ncbi:hypothetical protein OS493_027399 [Desmophyllum pertusum]|uniref:Uncharacterized protein n=1 Tax=Desmophyllum pertusum TaxID=174260 RepID=A0A9X0CJ24_9CNID|nr:hypothetical protein OS493_027399 [Desmophyllum pertusum]
MKQMLKKTDSFRSRRLNTIMEITETQDENGNQMTDSKPWPVKGDISSETCTATSLARRPYRRPSRDTTETYCPPERRIHCSHATPHTLSSASSHWREKASVSITPAGVVSSSSESLTASPRLKSGHDISEVELFFPEFFTDSEMQRTGEKIETTVYNEPNTNSQSDNEDPLVQSWLDLFGSQVCG